MYNLNKLNLTRISESKMMQIACSNIQHYQWTSFLVNFNQSINYYYFFFNLFIMLAKMLYILYQTPQINEVTHNKYNQNQVKDSRIKCAVIYNTNA